MYKLFVQIILLNTMVFSHQFFLTTTEVRLSDNQKNLEVTIQTFSHDVEALLKAADFNLANLGSDREDNAIDDFLIDYLSENFIIQDHYWKYVGKKVDGDFTLFFLEIEKFKLNLSILEQKFEQGKEGTKTSFEKGKLEFNQFIETIKAKYEKKEETKWEHFQVEVSEAFMHFKKAFTQPS